MSAWRVRRSAAAAADRDLRRTHCHANEAAGSRRSTSGGIGVGNSLFVARVTCRETGSSPRLIEKLQHVGFLGIMSCITLIKAHLNAGRLQGNGEDVLLRCLSQHVCRSMSSNKIASSRRSWRGPRPGDGG